MIVFPFLPIITVLGSGTMCVYEKPMSMFDRSLEAMLAKASSTNSIGCYTSGEVIHLWGNCFTYSYHAPDGSERDGWNDALDYYHSRTEAALAMANFVWSMNSILHMLENANA